MEETSGPRERVRADWVGKPDGEYGSKGPGDNTGAGRKEKYRAWKLGGARAYMIAAKTHKSKYNVWERETRESRGSKGA
jgi:hypothetical protein